jgi:hypothetical protein
MMKNPGRIYVLYVTKKLYVRPVVYIYGNYSIELPVAWKTVHEKKPGAGNLLILSF